MATTWCGRIYVHPCPFHPSASGRARTPVAELAFAGWESVHRTGKRPYPESTYTHAHTNTHTHTSTNGKNGNAAKTKSSASLIEGAHTIMKHYKEKRKKQLHWISVSDKYSRQKQWCRQTHLNSPGVRWGIFPHRCRVPDSLTHRKVMNSNRTSHYIMLGHIMPTGYIRRVCHIAYFWDHSFTIMIIRMKQSSIWCSTSSYLYVWSLIKL